MAEDLLIGDKSPPVLELGQFWRHMGQTYCFRPQTGKDPNSACVGCRWETSCQKSHTETKVGAGLNIRRAFRARPGFKLVAIDYRGIELRVAAQLSGEPVWKDAFLNGRDLHTEMAKIAFHTETPTKAQRDQAKCCNFGNLFLGNVYTLVRQSGMEEAEAS